MSEARSPRVTAQWPIRQFIGSILLLFSVLMAFIFALQGNRPLLVAVMVLPFAICGFICLLVKKQTALWCGWAFLLSLGLSELDPVGQLLWPGYIPFFLTLALVLYTAWVLRDRLWGSPRRRGLFIWGWLYAAVIYYLTRTLGFEFYGTFVLWLSRGQRLAWSRLGHSLLVLSHLLFLALATTALSALLYGLCAWLRKRRSRLVTTSEGAEV